MSYVFNSALVTAWVGLMPFEMFGRKDAWLEGPPDWVEGDMYTTTNDRELVGKDKNIDQGQTS